MEVLAQQVAPNGSQVVLQQLGQPHCLLLREVFGPFQEAPSCPLQDRLIAVPLQSSRLLGTHLVFRAYNEGVAYRLETGLPKPQVKVYSEEAVFRFAADHTVFYPEEESFFSHNERAYLPRKMRELAPAALGSLPAVVDAGGVKVAIAESDVEDYPGLWLRGTNGNALTAAFPPYPLKEAPGAGPRLQGHAGGHYIAVTKGTRTFPWRLMGIAEKDGDLITNPLVWLLAKPSQVQDTSWIKPGKVAWGDGSFRMETYQDGVNANRMASDYKLVRSGVTQDTRMKIHLAEGGGWAARIHP